jgi:hypothetical protein
VNLSREPDEMWTISFMTEGQCTKKQACGKGLNIPNQQVIRVLESSSTRRRTNNPGKEARRPGNQTPDRSWPQFIDAAV